MSSHIFLAPLLHDFSSHFSFAFFFSTSSSRLVDTVECVADDYLQVAIIWSFSLIFFLSFYLRKSFHYCRRERCNAATAEKLTVSDGRSDSLIALSTCLLPAVMTTAAARGRQ